MASTIVIQGVTKGIECFTLKIRKPNCEKYHMWSIHAYLFPFSANTVENYCHIYIINKLEDFTDKFLKD